MYNVSVVNESVQVTQAYSLLSTYLTTANGEAVWFLINRGCKGFDGGGWSMDSEPGGHQPVSKVKSFKYKS